MLEFDPGENIAETGQNTAAEEPGVVTAGGFLAVLQTYAPQPLPRRHIAQPAMVSLDSGVRSVMPSIRDCWVAAQDIAAIADSETVEESAGCFAALLAHFFALYLECRNDSPDQADRLQRLIDDGAECVAPGTMLAELRAGRPRITSLATEFQTPRREQRGLSAPA